VSLHIRIDFVPHDQADLTLSFPAMRALNVQALYSRKDCLREILSWGRI